MSLPLLLVIFPETDGIVGEVLFFTLRETLGPSVYTMEIHKIWVKIYSRMLRTIVPVAVAMEMKGFVSERDFPADSRYSTSPLDEETTQASHHHEATAKGDDLRPASTSAPVLTCPH